MRSAYTNRRDIRELSPRLAPVTEFARAKPLNSLPIKTRSPAFHIKGYGASHVGCKRLANEDSFWILPQNGLFIVADGMGGHAGGQIASTIAAQEMGRNTLRLLAQAEESARAAGEQIDLYQLLKTAFFYTSSEVIYTTERYPELASMGSTLTTLLTYGDQAYLAHVGDSRAYMIRDQELIQVTEDHSFVQELVNFGEISPDEAYTHMRRNLISRSVSRNETMIDVSLIKLREGDRFILCSDGLIEHVRDHDILETALSVSSSRVPQALIERANSSDHRSSSGVGTDNTSVVFVEVGSRRARR